MSQDIDDHSAAPRGRWATSGSGGARVSKRPGRASGGAHFAGSTTHRYQNYATHDSYDSDGMAEQAAPRPVLDPAETGSFQRIDASMGAKVETRDNVERLSADSTASWRRSGYGSEKRLSDAYRPQTKAHEPKTHANRKFVIAIIVLAAIVVGIGGYLAYNILNQPKAQKKTEEVEQTVVPIDQSVRYRDATYSITKQDDGSYALVSTVKSGDGLTVLSTLTGTPVNLVLYNGTLVVPENLDGSWDVVAYTIGMGTPASQVVNSDGTAVSGKGQIDSVKLDGSDLQITDDSGNTTKVALSGDANSIDQTANKDDGSSSAAPGDGAADASAGGAAGE